MIPMEPVKGKIVGFQRYIVPETYEDLGEEIIFDGWKFYVAHEQPDVYGAEVDALFYEGCIDSFFKCIGGGLENLVGHVFEFYVDRKEILNFKFLK